MTKDESEILAIQAVGFEFSDDARRTLSILEALGMLKLDEPKGPNERAVDAMFERGTVITPRHAVLAIEAAGLKIVEK